MSVVSPVPNTPQHVAVVMDGNGRWAAQRNLPRSAGHKAGIDAVQHVIEASVAAGVQYLTLFAFSSENWRRPKQEVNFLMGLFTSIIKSRVQQLHDKDIKLTFIGDHTPLGNNLREAMQYAQNLTQNNRALHVIVALNYGGQWDMLQASQALMRKAKDGVIEPSDLTEEIFHSHLMTHEYPTPDLLIRTSGEQRLSNFLLWQLAYTELYFVETLWPDFGRVDFEKALQVYSERQRRFGDVSNVAEVRQHA